MEPPGTSDYEEHRALIYQLLPRLRDQMELLDFTLHRLQQLKGECFDDAFERLLGQQCLRSVGGDQYELVSDYGNDHVGLLLWCINKTQTVIPLRYTDVRIKSLIETVCDRRHAEPKPDDCQQEVPPEQHQQTKRDTGDKENAYARGRGERAARPCKYPPWARLRTPCVYEDYCFWT